MISRVIIEQKIHDMEVAIWHQEELVKSQREILNSLKALLAAEFNKVTNAISTGSAGFAPLKPPSLPLTQTHSQSLHNMVDLTNPFTQASPYRPVSSGIQVSVLASAQKKTSLPIPQVSPPAAPHITPPVQAASSSSVCINLDHYVYSVLLL
ncbi:hypothetical protein EON65_26790, partial [archaeon]